jgi:hypothetical protein
MLLRSLVVLPFVASSSLALAQPDPTVDPAAPPEPTSDANASTIMQDPAPPPPAVETGLRNGFSLSAGFESGGDRDLSATLIGVDWCIGYRVNRAISVHLHSHMSFGSGKEGAGASGFTGNFASAIIGEYTLPMRLFVGAGGGWGVLNNPNGPLAQLRAGYYPFALEAAGKKRHLNVAFDLRFYFANQGYGTVPHYAISLGYDRF